MLQNMWMHWIMLKLHGLPNEGKEGEKKKTQTKHWSPMNSERYATKRFTLKSTLL